MNYFDESIALMSNKNLTIYIKLNFCMYICDILINKVNEFNFIIFS